MRWRERLLHGRFDLGALAKGIDGVLEIVGRGLLFVVNPSQLHRVERLLRQHELSEDPDDVVATYLLHTAQHRSAGARTLAAAYLLWHGAMKVGLIAGLLLRRRWAYPVAVVAFLPFLAYQLYRYTRTFPRSCWRSRYSTWPSSCRPGSNTRVCGQPMAFHDPHPVRLPRPDRAAAPSRCWGRIEMRENGCAQRRNTDRASGSIPPNAHR